MKKFIKTLSLLLIAVFVSFPFTGCSDKTASKTTTDIAAENITDENSDETATNTSTEEKTEEITPNEETEEICGIYSYQRSATLKDVWFEKEDQEGFPQVVREGQGIALGLSSNQGRKPPQG